MCFTDQDLRYLEASQKECNKNSPRERPGGTFEFVLLQFILDMRPGGQEGGREEGRSLDLCPHCFKPQSFPVNKQYRASGGGGGGGAARRLSHAAQGIYPGIWSLSLHASAAYLNTGLIGVFPGDT